MGRITTILSPNDHSLCFFFFNLAHIVCNSNQIPFKNHNINGSFKWQSIVVSQSLPSPSRYNDKCDYFAFAELKRQTEIKRNDSLLYNRTVCRDMVFVIIVWMTWKISMHAGTFRLVCHRIKIPVRAHTDRSHTPHIILWYVIVRSRKFCLHSFIILLYKSKTNSHHIFDVTLNTPTIYNQCVFCVLLMIVVMHANLPFGIYYLELCKFIENAKIDTNINHVFLKCKII